MFIGQVLMNCFKRTFHLLQCQKATYTFEKCMEWMRLNRTVSLNMPLEEENISQVTDSCNPGGWKNEKKNLILKTIEPVKVRTT